MPDKKLSTPMCRKAPPRARDFGVDTFFKDRSEQRKITSCSLPKDHKGPHFFILSGVPFTWEFENDCGCCGPKDKQRCFVYWEVNKVQEFVANLCPPPT